MGIGLASLFGARRDARYSLAELQLQTNKQVGQIQYVRYGISGYGKSILRTQN